MTLENNAKCDLPARTDFLNSFSQSERDVRVRTDHGDPRSVWICRRSDLHAYGMNRGSGMICPTCVLLYARLLPLKGNFWVLDAGGLLTGARASGTDEATRRFARAAGGGEDLADGANVEQVRDSSPVQVARVARSLCSDGCSTIVVLGCGAVFLSTLVAEYVGRGIISSFSFLRVACLSFACYVFDSCNRG